MSDINRSSIPYGQQVVSNKSKNVNRKTVRIVVTLSQSNDHTCPEYNYKDELDAVKKRGSTKDIENGGDNLDLFDDDDDVKRIAREMEEKYGNYGVASSKKKRKRRKDDYADIGMGYDESDSFIDNTDGYDEMVPANVTAIHGGFYINCGALEFKTEEDDSEDSSSDSSGSTSPSSKNGKRTLESDESDAEDADRFQGKKSRIDSSGINGMQKAIKKKLFSPNKILKRSSKVHKKTVRDLLKEKRKDLNISSNRTGAEDEDEVDENKAVFEEGEKNMENGISISNSINDAIESVVKASDEIVRGAERLSSQSTNENNKPVDLPENLPNSIAEVINKIKQTAANSTGSNRFTDEINNLLSSLEKKCKCLGKPSKIKVHDHISYHMKVDKQVLTEHCKQLALKDEEKKIKSLLNKLKAEIDKLMPSIIQNYSTECDLVLEKRLELMNQPGGDEERKKLGKPKRKFRWNDQTKKFLKDTATIKKRSYLQQGNSKEAWEEELANFLRSHVIDLWPKGWMTMTTLTKVCVNLFNDPKNNNANHNSNHHNKKENNSKTTASYNNSLLNCSNSSVTSANNTPNNSFGHVNNNKIGKNAEKNHEKKEQPVKEHNNKERTKEKEKSTDTENNNGSAFFKIEYDKAPQVALSPVAKATSPQVASVPPKTPPVANNNSSKSSQSVPAVRTVVENGPSSSSSSIVIKGAQSVSVNSSSNVSNAHRPAASFPVANLKTSQNAVANNKPTRESENNSEKTATVTFPNVSIIELDSKDKKFNNILPIKKPKIIKNNDIDLATTTASTFSRNVMINRENNVVLNKNKEFSFETVTDKQNFSALNNKSVSLEENHRNLSESEDIQKVMEHLKNLQKMSSPVKTFEGSSSSNSATVISHKAASGGASKNNVDSNAVTPSFQDEFQKQLIYGGLSTFPSSKSNNKCS